MKNSQKILNSFSKEKIENLFEKVGYGICFEDLKFAKRPLAKTLLVNDPAHKGEVDGFKYVIKKLGKKQAYRAGGMWWEPNYERVEIDLNGVLAIAHM